MATDDRSWRPPSFADELALFKGQLRTFGFARKLGRGNINVQPKVRQQLQALRDKSWLAFSGRGTYRRV